MRWRTRPRAGWRSAPGTGLRARFEPRTAPRTVNVSTITYTADSRSTPSRPSPETPIRVGGTPAWHTPRVSDDDLLRRAEQALTEIKVHQGLIEEHAAVLAALRIRL